MTQRIPSILGKSVVLSLFCASVGFAPRIFAKDGIKCHNTFLDKRDIKTHFSFESPHGELPSSGTLSFRKLPGNKTAKKWEKSHKTGMECNHHENKSFCSPFDNPTEGSFYFVYDNETSEAKVLRITKQSDADKKMQVLNFEDIAQFPRSDALNQEEMGPVFITTLTCKR